MFLDILQRVYIGRIGERKGYRLHNVYAININQSVRNIINTATVVAPIYHHNVLKGKPEDTFRTKTLGARIDIYAGYYIPGSSTLNRLFTGFIRDIIIGSDTITLECQDYSYKIMQRMNPFKLVYVTNKMLENTSINEVQKGIEDAYRNTFSKNFIGSEEMDVIIYQQGKNGTVSGNGGFLYKNILDYVTTYYFLNSTDSTGNNYYNDPIAPQAPSDFRIEPPSGYFRKKVEGAQPRYLPNFGNEELVDRTTVQSDEINIDKQKRLYDGKNTSQTQQEQGEIVVLSDNPVLLLDPGKDFERIGYLNIEGGSTATGIEYLKHVKQTTGWNIYFSDHYMTVQPMHTSNPFQAIIPVFDGIQNMMDIDANVKKLSQNRIHVRVTGTSAQSGNSKIEATAGATTGVTEVNINIPGITTRQALQDRANEVLKQYSWDGVDGTIRTWLTPFVRMGDKVKLQNIEPIPEGEYYVESISTSISKGGAHRTMKLTRRITENQTAATPELFKNTTVEIEPQPEKKEKQEPSVAVSKPKKGIENSVAPTSGVVGPLPVLEGRLR